MNYKDYFKKRLMVEWYMGSQESRDAYARWREGEIAELRDGRKSEPVTDILSSSKSFNDPNMGERIPNDVWNQITKQGEHSPDFVGPPKPEGHKDESQNGRLIDHSRPKYRPYMPSDGASKQIDTRRRPRTGGILPQMQPSPLDRNPSKVDRNRIRDLTAFFLSRPPKSPFKK